MNTLRDIADLIQGQIIGDETLKVPALSAIEHILPGTLVFAEGEDNLKRAEASEACAILVNKNYTQSSKALIQVNNPYHAFIRLLQHFDTTPAVTPGIHPTAVIGQNVQIGEGVYIGPYVVIEADSHIGAHCVLKSHIHIGHKVRVGAHCIIHSHVSIYDHCQIEEQVIIHASTVIGADGFGYAHIDGQQVKVPHIGHVHLEKNVEIGANTAVDRATLGATVIGEGTKIDNLVQIAHSVKLGKHNIVCGFTGIAGSTTTGDHVVFAANVGVADHVRIDDRVVLAARAGVPPKKHLRQDMVYLGSPARPKDVAIKLELAANRIPLMRKQIHRLTEQVAALTKQLEKLCENP